MTDFAEDEISIGTPDKGFAASIVMEQVFLNGLLQLTHAAEGTTTDAFMGDLGKEAFHLIELTGRGGREMQVIVGMLHKPTLHFVHFVRAVIIHY